MKEIKLFDYQEDMKSRIEKALRLHRSVMAQMPTGTGKTYLLTAVIDSFVSNNPMEKVWIVAHRRELVSQIDETVRKFHSYSTSNTSSLLSSVKAMSIQWLMRHYDEIEEEPGMIVIDEAHHALAKTYKEMWERFPKAKFLGLTATPCRLNGKGFTDLFDVLVQSWCVPEFISKGRLVTYDFVSIKSDGVTQRLIDSLQKRGADGDYQNKEMDMLLNKKPSIERLYRSLEEYGKDRKGIVYAINISHAQKITKLYQENGVKAIAIDSKTPATERQLDIEAFKKGAIQVLVNVDIFSEGFDCPDVEFVQLARPTLSLAKYLQMVGRGLRVAKGKKNCVIIDNVGLYRVFGLPSQVWNWNAMFEGKLKVGKKKETPKEREFFLMSKVQDDIQINPDSELMMVMSHEELMQSLKYREFVDCNDDFAIVKLPDGKMTVVNRQGEQVIEPGNYYDMKFLQGNILSYRPRRKTVCYYDLLARVVIDEDIHAKDAPEVITINKWEFIEYNGLFRSRTYEYFALPFRPSQYDLWNYGYYLIYNFQRSTASGCQEWIYKEEDGGSMRMYKENSEKACFLRGDHTHVYWLCADLYDNGIVVMDSHEDYYYVDSNLKKTYIGCNQPKTESENLMVAMPRLGKVVYDSINMKDAAKKAKQTADKAKKTAGTIKKIVQVLIKHPWLIWIVVGAIALIILLASFAWLLDLLDNKNTNSAVTSATGAISSSTSNEQDEEIIPCIQTVIKEIDGEYKYTFIFDITDEEKENVKAILNQNSIELTEENINFVTALVRSGYKIEDNLNKDTLESLLLFYKAQIASESLDLRSSDKILVDGEYTACPISLEQEGVQGTVRLERVNIDENSKTQRVLMSYIPKESFEQLLQGNSQDIKNYFTVNSAQNCLISGWRQTKVTYEYPENYPLEKEQNVDTTTVSCLNGNSGIPYKNYINKYTMPSELLTSLRIYLDDMEFCKNLVKCVENSNIVISLHETSVIQTSEYTEEHKIRDVKYYDYFYTEEGTATNIQFVKNFTSLEQLKEYIKNEGIRISR